jgi:trehalose 6-phosphate synthase
MTPLMDGMNLVAVAARDAADPGVLVLSQVAGAAGQMEDARVVNPHDAWQGAATIRTALTIPARERRRQHERLAAGRAAQDAHGWSGAFPRLRHGPRPARDA